MTKTNILLSVVTAAVVFTGCGGSSSSTPATPDVNGTTQYSVKQVADLKTAAAATGSTTTGATTTGDVSATGKTKETLASNITSDLTLTTDKIWIISGLVSVKDGATLTIPAGTLLAGKSGTGSPFQS